MADPKKVEGKPAPKAPNAEEAAPKLVSEKLHHIKVTQMSLKQVEEALEKAQKNMGGFNSHYARALLARREFLSVSRSIPVPVSLPKAA